MISDIEWIPKENRLTVEVLKLNYFPYSEFVQDTIQQLSHYLPSNLKTSLVNVWKRNKASALEDVTFRADPTRMMAILAESSSERRTLLELISNRRDYGVFGGDITFKSISNQFNSQNFIAFVPRAAIMLYIPGLTYHETLTYATKLRTQNREYGDNKFEINTRVLHLLNLMGLTWCKDRLITERPTTRGSLGGELRKLSIAVEIVNLPPVIVLDDATRDLDATVSCEILECLRTLANGGHTVICGLPKPPAQVLTKFDDITLLACGRSIYASSLDSVVKHFTSSSLNFRKNDDVEIVDFIFDIANGTERPQGSRKPLTVEALQTQFYLSKFYNEDINANITSKTSLSILPTSMNVNSAYIIDSKIDFGLLLSRSFTIISRAIHVKFKEYEVLKKSLISSVVTSLFMGYFLYNQGNFGDYTMSLLSFPYPKVTNLGSCLFLMTSAVFLQQILNVHILCQKIQVFRYERSAKCSSTFGFFLASFISEVPFTVFFALIFANITYYLAVLNDGIANYAFYMTVQMLVSIIGYTTTLMLAALIRNEIAVRNIFLFFLFMMIMTAGFIFQLPAMTKNVVNIAVINCLRWSYEALMVWKFYDYPDGPSYLESYDFQSFEKHRVFRILVNFIIFDMIVFLIALIPLPNSLHRRKKEFESISRDSRDSIDFLSGKVSKQSDLLQPNIFTRESSVTGKTKLSSQNSISEGFGENRIRGNMVTFRNLSYRVPDRKSPMGYRNILHGLNGRFDWGRLSAIMGADKAGKSSLLNVLGGQFIGTSSQISGQVLYDNCPFDTHLQPWQRCAFVEALDEHFRDLTVSDTLTFAMQLRCLDQTGFLSVDLNVKRTLELLKLTDQAHVKSKYLDPGSLRRLSIAEEMVHGPSLIFVDEPITGLGPRDTSIIMTGAFRELVNQDRTVIVTMHEPSAVAYELLDTLCLLSKGRLIYMGPAKNAAKFFIDSSILQLELREYANPADFLADVSGCKIQNKAGMHIDVPVLEHHYSSSEIANQYRQGFLELSIEINSDSTQKVPFASLDNSEKNPMMKLRLDSDDQRKPERSVTLESFVSDFDPNVQSKVSYLCQQFWSGLFLFIFESLLELSRANISFQFIKATVLFKRAWYVLLFRRSMIILSSITILYLALVFSWILGESRDDFQSVTGLIGVGTMCITLANLQFVYWLYTNNQIFLREHSRGLYSSLLHWIVDDLPLLLLRSIQGIIYAVIVQQFVDLQKSDIGFFILGTWLSFIASTLLVGSIVYILPDVRSAYSVIPGSGFLLFFFSGIIIKPSTLPDWLSFWLPSVSFVRWLTQALVINEYQNNRDAFPEIGPNKYSTYNAYLAIFGWGGKSKWFCLKVLLLNIFIYKIFQLLVSIITTVSQRGTRSLRRLKQEVRLY